MRGIVLVCEPELAPAERVISDHEVRQSRGEMPHAGDILDVDAQALAHRAPGRLALLVPGSTIARLCSIRSFSCDNIRPRGLRFLTIATLPWFFVLRPM
jgi:hypothetical protein